MGEITGLIKNTHDVPLEDVTIVIVGGPVQQDIAAVTGEDGTFALPNLQPGNYLIKAFGEVVSDAIPVPVMANDTAFVEIWLEKATINEDYLIKEEPDWISEDANLTGTKWKLKNIRPMKAHNAQGTRKTYLLEFPTNDTYYLKLDVNNCGGTYEIKSAGSIHFKEMACTELCCDSPYANRLAQLIREITNYEMRGNFLLLRGNSEILLTRHFQQ